MNYIVAITGSSGAIYAKHLLKALAHEGCQIQLLISDPAKLVIAHELGIEIPEDLKEIRNTIRTNLLEDSNFPYLHIHSINDLTSPIASGSVPTQGMIILPCSMGTLGRIANGMSSNLIERAADVTLKEKRLLILAPRETPLSSIHLRNMLEISQAGAHIIPCMPGFYHKPKDIQDLTNFVVGKILDALGIEHTLYRRWQT